MANRHFRLLKIGGQDPVKVSVPDPRKKYTVAELMALRDAQAAPPANSHTFSVGDVVQLKSGGLSMTLEYVKTGCLDTAVAGVVYAGYRDLTRQEIALACLKHGPAPDRKESGIRGLVTDIDDDLPF